MCYLSDDDIDILIFVSPMLLFMVAVSIILILRVLDI